MEQQILFQGSESKIYLKDEGTLVKERFNKKYRNPALHSLLTKERINAECRNINRCIVAGIRAPKIIEVDMKAHKIYMEYIKDSITVKKFINDLEKAESEHLSEKLIKLGKDIGETIGQMHKIEMVHGDLTTSNMLLDGDELVLIDFGLSKSAATIEEKAVDLYVLEKGLLSTHACAEELFKQILAVYVSAAGNQGALVEQKLREVRARGRKRSMIG